MSPFSWVSLSIQNDGFIHIACQFQTSSYDDENKNETRLDLKKGNSNLNTIQKDDKLTEKTKTSFPAIQTCPI